MSEPEWSFWEPEQGPLQGPLIAFDTETTVVDLTREVPELVVLVAYDGQRCVCVEPHNVPAFVVAHDDREWVGHNVAFDWWAVQRVLAWFLHHEPIVRWQDAIDRMHDTLILDQLWRLATEVGAEIYQRDLGELSRVYCGQAVDKEDPYRMRFAEILGRLRDPEAAPFLSYATKDVISTYRTFLEIRRRYLERGFWDGEAPCKVPLSLGGPVRDAVEKFGPLTERIQVRASIVLAAIGRNGMRVDRSLLRETRERLHRELWDAIRWLEALCPNLFHRYREKKRAGQLRFSSQTGAPMMDTAVLRAKLVELAQKNGIEMGTLPRTPTTGAIQTGLNLWVERIGHEPFVAKWAQLMQTAKALQFIVKLEAQVDDEVHTRYTTLVRTGRTSASEPNIQNMPRVSWFRSLFVARPGHRLVIADYSGIEMVTLAAVLQARYGQSVLADVIRAGRDTHSYTASIVRGMDYEEFVARLEEEEALPPEAPHPLARDRQAAKALNFGVPGGLGAAKLSSYAAANYGVRMTVAEARDLREQLITVVYPDVGRYLEDDTAHHLASALMADPEAVKEWLSGSPARQWGAERIVSGMGMRDGKVYSDFTQKMIWEALRDLNRNPSLTEALEAEVPSPRLALRLFGRNVWTLTGRLRTGCSYTEAHNTPFQGLAADGAKLALWHLWRAGYRILAFIHDEVVIEVPESMAEGEAPRIAGIMSRSMQEVLGTDLPVKVKYVISDRWQKG